MTDAMRRLLALRQHAVERARVTLSVALRSEAEASAALRALDEQVAVDRVVRGELMAQDLRFALFDVANREQVQQRRQAAADACRAARDQVVACRAALAIARTDAAAVAELIEERRIRAMLAAERAEQQVLEDVDRVRGLRAQEIVS
jgi:hypothetical protein